MVLMTWTDDKIDALATKVDEGFSKADVEFARIDERFKRTDERFDKIDATLVRMEAKFDAKFDAINRTAIQLFGGMIGTLVIALVTVIATH